MSRVSYRDRISRLTHQLRGQPTLTVHLAPSMMAVLLGREPTAEELRLTLAEFMARHQAESS